MKDYLHIIQVFTQHLTNTKTVSEVCWEITKNVIAKIGFEDCVVYLHDPETNVLVQMAAHGPKNPVALDIYHPITIKPGQGIVGSVFVSGRAEIIPDTRLDKRYIVDDQARLSEIAVPILHNGIPIGVIDSEHPDCSFFTGDHLLILNTLAAIASNKIVKTRAFETLEQVNKNLAEKNRVEEEKNRELLQLNQQLDEVIYSLSHDFRSPILAAIGMTDLLKRHPSNADTLYPMLNDSLKRVDNILINIHYFSQNLRRPIDHTACDVGELMAEVFMEIKHPRKTVTDFMIHCPGPIICLTDVYRLDVLFRQVYLNALQFHTANDRQSEIKVNIAREANNCIIRITDNGPGMPDQYCQEIGTMFRRGSTQSTGAGLGIFLCTEISHKIGAVIQWANIPNGGTEVTLQLPCTD
ncbi:MAG: ATP-binding protein [Ferruginibacter sp.]